MATYYDIFGQKVQYLSSDPNPVVPGQIWYNSSTSALKGEINVASNTWSTGGTVPTVSDGITSGGGGGSKTAGWLVGGLQYPGGSENKSWTYDGTSWTAGTNLPQGKTNVGSTGPQTSGLVWGGTAPQPGTTTFEYDGSSWTAGGAFPSNEKEYPIGSGASQTAALSMGGRGDPPPSGNTSVYTYNGTSWATNPHSLPTGQYNGAGDGPNTATWIAGGAGPSPSTSAFTYNGSSWTAAASTNVSHTNLAPGQGFGTTTDALVCGGDGPTDQTSENYDGTCWSVGATMTTKRYYGGSGASSAGGTSNGYVVGGSTPTTSPTHSDATEEYTKAGPATVTITTT